MRRHSVSTRGLAAILFMAFPLAAAETPPQWRSGEQAPLFTLKSIDGGTFDAASLKGKPAVLFFAATWCPYSSRKAKAVEDVHRRYKGRAAVVLINIKEPGEKASAKWRDEKKLSCPLLLDADGTVARAYGPPPDFLPKQPREDLMSSAVILLDAESRIRWYPQMTENPAKIDWDLVEVKALLDTMVPKKGWFRGLFGG